MTNIELYLSESNELTPYIKTELNSLAVPFDIRHYRIEKIIQLIEQDFHLFLHEVKSNISHNNYHYGLIRACEEFNAAHVPTLSRFKLLNEAETSFYCVLMTTFIRGYMQYYKQRFFHEIEDYIAEKDETHKKIENLETENLSLTSQITQHQETIQQLLQKIESFEMSIKTLEEEVSRQQTFKEKLQQEEKEHAFKLKKHEIDTNASNQKSREQFELDKAKIQLETTKLRLKKEQENADKFENTVRDLQNLLKD